MLFLGRCPIVKKADSCLESWSMTRSLLKCILNLTKISLVAAEEKKNSMIVKKKKKKLAKFKSNRIRT